jgi:hypothetical protein
MNVLALSRINYRSMAPKKDKEEAILEAMLDLVGERGFHNAPMFPACEALRCECRRHLLFPLLCYSQITLMHSEK